MNESKRTFTDDEIIRRVWDLENIKDLMGRRAFYLANEQRQRELDELWVREEENRKSASLGRNWGFYVGMDAIRDYYVVKHAEDRRSKLAEYCAARPELELCDGNLGYGCMTAHPSTTPWVYLAQDGKTAQGVFFAMAQDTTGHPDGSCDAVNINELMAVDFIREESGWKIWHLFLGTDLIYASGRNVEDISCDVPVEENPVYQEFGTPTLPMLAHNDRLHWSDYDDFWPKDYETYDPARSYGPDRWLNRKEKVGW